MGTLLVLIALGVTLAVDPDVPPRPKAPGGEDLHWSLFEAEFRAYVAPHERRRDLIAAL